MVKRIVQALGGKLLDYYDREPVRVHAAIAAAVVAAGTAAGLVLSAPLVIVAVAFVAPVIVAEVRGVVASPQTQQELALAQPNQAAAEILAELRPLGEPVKAP